jgi:secreted trypsin-like serine protease
MRRPALIATLAALLLGILVAPPASAVRYGQADAGRHPYVGLLVAFVDGAPAWQCSGALLSPTTLLTAGHCTDGADRVVVWFEEDLRDAPAVGFPLGGRTSVPGTPLTHPGYAQETFSRHDLGVVRLDAPVRVARYASLPAAGILDRALTTRGQKPRFTAVGFGMQRSMPEPSGQSLAERVRLTADLRLVNADAAHGEQKAGNSVTLSSNAATGGTCSGDSGGPVLEQGGHVVVAVVSYALNERCAGLSGAYRVDTADDLAWLAGLGIR